MLIGKKICALLLGTAMLTATLAGCDTSNLEISTHASMGAATEAVTEAVTDAVTDTATDAATEEATQATKEEVTTSVPLDTTEITAEDTTQGTHTPTPPEAETKPKDYVCELPDNLNYGKEEVNVLFSQRNGGEDEMTGYSSTMLSQAVYDRNVAVEEQLGVKLHFIANTDNTVADKLSKDLLGGLQAYDIVANGTYLAIGSVIDGYYRDLNRTENVNTSKDYWAQGYTDMVTFTSQSKQYLVTGDVALSLPRFTYLTIYNKDLVTAAGLPDMYDVVKSGNWTLEYQYGMINSIATNPNFSSAVSRGNLYGFVTGDTVSIDPYVVASDIHLIVQDPKTHALTFNEGEKDALVDLCDKVQRLYHASGTYVFEGQYMDDIGKTNIMNMFLSQKAVMATTQFYTMELCKNSLGNVNYGIAPIPKRTADQPAYYSYVQDQVTGFGISAGVASHRTAMVGATLEAIGYQSYLTVRPAYYDATLAIRLIQDEASYEMLQLIIDSVSFDFSSTCGNISPVSMRDQLRPILSGNNANIGSKMASWSRSLARSLTQVNRKLERLETV